MRTRRSMIWRASPCATRSTSTDRAKMVGSDEPGLSSEPDVFDVNPGELRRSGNAVRVELLEALDDILGARNIKAGLTREALNRTQRQDVALRVASPVGGGPIRDAEPHGLVHH